MKKNILLFFVVSCSLFVVSSMFGQVPQAFKYQVVVRDSSGNSVTSETVYFRISILKGVTLDTVAYSEEQQTETNKFGIASLNIGMGNNQQGSIDSINWGTGTYFIKIEFTETSGGTYQVMGTSQLLSVPYALYAAQSGTKGITGPTGATGTFGVTGTKGQTLYNNGAKWISNSNLYNDSTNVGIGTTNPQAKFDITTTTSGFLPPRMTTIQMNTISNPAQGLTVYNTDVHGLCFYDIKWNCFNGSSFNFICGTGITDSRDGQVYKTIQIGTQCWMAQNLNVGTIIDSMANQTNNGIIEKYCISDNNNNCKTYGGLYQWDEMMNYDTIPDIQQGICPSGWHIPSDEEWFILENYVDTTINISDTSATGWQGTDCGTNLKLTGNSGFNALFGGVRSVNGQFGDFNVSCYFWSSTYYYLNLSWVCCRIVGDSYNGVDREYTGKPNGFSVRCIKN